MVNPGWGTKFYNWDCTWCVQLLTLNVYFTMYTPVSRDSEIRLYWFHAFWTDVVGCSETSGLGLLSELLWYSYLRIKVIIEMALSFCKKRSVSLETRGNFLFPCLCAAFYSLFCLWVLLNTEGREHFIQYLHLTTVVRKPPKKRKKKYMSCFL